MKQQTKAIQILIFEDFHAETESLLRELQDAEMLFDAHVVSSVAEYEKTLFSNSPDVILSPYSLKGTNAVKLLGLARKHGIDAPFILLAFDLSEDIAIDLLAEGIEDYVQRSTIKRLPIAIKKALQRYKTQLELLLSEAKLRGSEASLQEAQKIAKIGSWEWDVGTEQVWWSEEMYRIYETDKTDIKLKDVRSFIHPEDRERINAITENDLNENITSVLEYRILLESGKVKYVTSSAKQVKDASGKVVRLIGTLQDVTDQIRSKEELKAQNLQKDLILNTAKVGIWHWKVNSDKLIWDERCAQVFESFSMEVDTEAFYNLIHPDDRDYVYQRLVDGLKKGEYSAEYRVVQNGKTSYVISRGRSTFGPDGKATRMDGIIIDMTERHLMENALRQSEQLFRDMAESITEVFWLTDWELNEVLYVSPQYETLYGQSIQSLYEDPASWSHAIHPDDRDRVTTKFRQLAASGSYDEEYRLLMKDGTVKWVRDRAFPVFHSDGSVSRVAGITENITERKRVQVQVKTLSLVASETSNGVLIHDALGRIIWANEGFTNITGYTAEEALGKEPWSFLSGPNTDHSLIEATYQKMKDGETFKSDNVLLTKDGNEVWINTAFNPIMDEKGELNQVVSIGVDITQQKELELLQKNMLDELERTNQELRRRAAR